jgi:transposase
MGHRTLLPDVGEVILDQLQVQGRDRLVMVLRPAATGSVCPMCRRTTRRIHSWYSRRLSDLPWEGIPVRIELRVRRFFCDAEGCGQRIFTERLPETAPRYARRTSRLSVALEQITWALGGAAGARLAAQLGILASDSTLLRQLRHRVVVDPAQAPRVLGIDDWAWRKGHRYGTILCDLERAKVIDLLPERSVESTEQWLRAHPGTRIISRDRASLYAEAATKAAPQAVQVADRWHLLHNLTETLVDVLRPHHRLLTEAARAIVKDAKPVTEAPVQQAATQATLPSHAYQMQEQNRNRRLASYEAVMELVRQGVSERQVARHCKMSRKTVRGWIRSQAFPERKQGNHFSAVDPYREYLEMRRLQGCCNGAQLWRELRSQGFTGRPRTLRDWLRKHTISQTSSGEHKPSVLVLPRRSPRQIAWLLLKEPDDARPYLKELYRQSAEITAVASAAREFCRIVRERDVAAWPLWCEAVASGPLAGFAKHLCRDDAAFLAALRLPWSNGPVEGHVHRLKLIKRSMYGRAKFDLLRLRVLHAA